MGQADLLVTFPPTRLAAQSSVDRQTIIPCLGTCTQPHKLTPPQPLYLARVGLFLGQTWSTGLARCHHPGPSTGTLLVLGPV